MSEVSFEQILGFSKAERIVWRSLSQHGQTIAELVRASKLPRMTVHKIVHRFHERGLAYRTKRNKRFYYRRTEPAALYRALQHFGPAPEETALAVENAGEISVYVGIPAMVRLTEQLASVKKARWSLLQSSENAQHITEKVPRRTIERLNRTIAANEQITDLFIEEEYVKEVSQTYTSSERSKWLKSLDRMAVVYILPKGTFSAKTDLILQQQAAYLLDWDNEVAFSITHHHTVLMYENFLSMLSATVPKTHNMDDLINHSHATTRL